MAEVLVEAKKREHFGTRKARQVRREGWVPGVFYIHGSETVHLVFDKLKLSYFLSHAHGLVDLTIQGEKKKRKCVLKDIQYDPLTEDVIHVDFLGVKMGEKLQLSVPLVATGTAVGTKEGGVVENALRELDIECLPKDIPEQLEVDISALDIGDSIQVRDLSFPNIQILNDPNETVAMVDVPRAIIEEDEAEEVEEELLEPEVIGEKKSEDDDEDDEKD